MGELILFARELPEPQLPLPPCGRLPRPSLFVSMLVIQYLRANLV